MSGCCSLPPNWKDFIENKNMCPKCSFEGISIDESTMEHILDRDNWSMVIEKEDYFRCPNENCPVSLFSRVDDMWFWNEDIIQSQRWK